MRDIVQALFAKHFNIVQCILYTAGIPTVCCNDFKCRYDNILVNKPIHFH